jgi:hypothetical protein
MEKQQRSESDLDQQTVQANAPAPVVDPAAQPAGPAATQAQATDKDSVVKAAAQVVKAQVGEPPSSPNFLHRLEHVISTSSEKVVHDAIAMAGGAKELAVEVGQHLEVAGGEAVGVAELAGVRYPVKPYEAQVDGGLYRGSRLDDAGMAALKQQGVQGVVSLCLEHTDDAALAAKYGLDALNVKILDNSAPTVAQMMEFIDFAKAHPPSYVHCEAGKGRTGTAVACYRIAVDGWTAERAIAEARTFGLSLVNQIAFIQSFAESVNGGSDLAPTPAPQAASAAAPA